MCLKKLWLKTTNLKKETDIQIQKAQKFPDKMGPNRPTRRHIIIKMAKAKDKEKILNALKENEELIIREYP